jgi:hypothetical protein
MSVGQCRVYSDGVARDCFRQVRRSTGQQVAVCIFLSAL